MRANVPRPLVEAHLAALDAYLRLLDELKDCIAAGRNLPRSRTFLVLVRQFSEATDTYEAARYALDQFLKATAPKPKEGK